MLGLTTTLLTDARTLLVVWLTQRVVWLLAGVQGYPHGGNNCIPPTLSTAAEAPGGR